MDGPPVSTFKNPRRSLTSQFAMARTKAGRANELATVAQGVNQFLMRKVERLERDSMNLRVTNYNQLKKHKKCEEALIDGIRRRNERISELERTWEDMAQTLNDALEDLQKLRIQNRTLVERLLDCECTEEEDLENELDNE